MGPKSIRVFKKERVVVCVLHVKKPWYERIARGRGTVPWTCGTTLNLSAIPRSKKDVKKLRKTVGRAVVSWWLPSKIECMLCCILACIALDFFVCVFSSLILKEILSELVASLHLLSIVLHTRSEQERLGDRKEQRKKLYANATYKWVPIIGIKILFYV